MPHDEPLLPAEPVPTGDTAPVDPPGNPIVINEVLYDPPAEGGDANGDGTVDMEEDEFVELVNTGSVPWDISGYQIFRRAQIWFPGPRHVVPAGTVLAPGQALVVFGGGSPEGLFGGARVQVATEGSLSLWNNNDEVRVMTPEGTQVLQFSVQERDSDPDQAYTRSPDGTGPFVLHTDASGARFSPGTRANGEPF